jgi:2-succinyl-5-enolpyruvyl-6-hydroxy-3-cyclohexene-1-carboxylate synthase
MFWKSRFEPSKINWGTCLGPFCSKRYFWNCNLWSMCLFYFYFCQKKRFWRKNRALLYALLRKIVNVFVNNPWAGRDVSNIPAGLDAAVQSKIVSKKKRHISYVDVWIATKLWREVFRRSTVILVIRTKKKKIVNVFVNNPRASRDVSNIPADLDVADQSNFLSKKIDIFLVLMGSD